MKATKIKFLGNHLGWGNNWYMNANSAWENIYAGLNQSGYTVRPRGQLVKEDLGCNIYIANPMDNLVYNEFRKLSPYYCAGEYMWYKSGDNTPESIEKHSKFWKKIANEDGTINSNYGRYIFKEKQWDMVVDILRKDPDSRQAIFQIPITENQGTKDVPCTSSIQFFIRDNKLYCTVYMRSNDIWLGFPYDVFNFTMWQIEMAKELGVELGWYRHVVGSMHLYEKDFICNKNKGEFEATVLTEYSVSDKSSSEFKRDLMKLNDKNNDVNDEVLKFMINNYTSK